ncbi:MAG: CoB--CoM heterodisulfide reductase iron-sulfur subunit A family protein, partial [Anaerolineales bacterium]|nr:CoB--CoM heterodisulfide reductase iron-sulfur subunit A family protein [Anaerolineales bacterium]
PDNNRHPNIQVLTLTEVVDFQGQAGDFTVTLRRNPRYVDVDKCVNCRLCSVVCPVSLPSEFQMGMAFRKAAYKTAPRAIPDAYVIERGPYCDDCGKCVRVCPTNAIELDQQPYFEEIHVGAVILAVGYSVYDPTPLEEFGYGRYENVVTPMQYERLASRSGPTEGIVARLSDGKLPNKIAWLQCIGSRDQDHPYCSSICCMFATKEAMLAKQRLSGVDCQIFVMDERAFNKEYTKYLEKARDSYGIKYNRCRVSAIKQDPESKDLILRFPDDNGKLIEDRFEMVVLATGMEPPARSAELAQMMNIDLNQYGFCETDKFHPLQTSQPGVYVAGAFQSPKEIAETVFDAAGAAGEVMRIYHDALGGAPVPREYPFLGATDEFPPERDISAEPAKVGVYVCGCGPVIANVVDIEGVVEYAKTLPGVTRATTMTFACFPDGLEQLEKEIEEYQLTRVVIAACSHRTHESLFQRIVRKAGLNPYLFELVNIREHCAWVHDWEPVKATRKSKELVRMAVHRVSRMDPIHRNPIHSFDRALVLGGGVSGMTAALTIADAGHDVTLIERSEILGGNLRNIYYLAEGLNPHRLLRDLINRVRGHHRIDVLTRSELKKITGSIGHFISQIESRGLEDETISTTTIEHGVIVVATGGVEGTTTKYLYGQDERVVTQLELEDWIVHQPEKVANLKHLVMVQCVEADEVGYFYCSRTCCTSTMKNAIRVKMLNPECQVTVLYKDIITYGFREEYYTDARRRGVLFVRYTDQQPPVFDYTNGDIKVSVTDPSLDNRPYEFKPDLVSLSMPVVPSERTSELAKILGLPLSSEGFFLEADLKMRPMDFVSEGIFLCGMAHYPRFIEESIASAQAAAGRSLTILSQDPFYIGGVIAEVDADKCVGCLTCVRTCPFQIPQVLYDRSGVGDLGGHAWIDPALCQGCGTCTGECPAAAIELVNYRDKDFFMEGNLLGAWLPEIARE